MKKLSAILLLLLLLFNLLGYRLLFAYTLQQWDSRIASYLDKEAYNEQDLISIKVPLSLPYQTDWKDFERVDGEISISGQVYKYVKRKVVNGELVLMCLPDHNKTKLETAKDEFFKLANNLQTTSPTKKTAGTRIASFNDLALEYDHHQPNYALPLCGYDVLKYLSLKEYTLPDPLLLTPEQPPDSHKA